MKLDKYLNNINGIEKKYVYGELDVVRDSLINVKSFDYRENKIGLILYFALEQYEVSERATYQVVRENSLVYNIKVFIEQFVQ